MVQAISCPGRFVKYPEAFNYEGHSPSLDTLAVTMVMGLEISSMNTPEYLGKYSRILEILVQLSQACLSLIMI